MQKKSKQQAYPAIFKFFKLKYESVYFTVAQLLELSSYLQ